MKKEHTALKYTQILIKLFLTSLVLGLICVLFIRYYPITFFSNLGLTMDAMVMHTLLIFYTGCFIVATGIGIALYCLIKIIILKIREAKHEQV